VVGRIAAAGLVGLVLQQVSVLVISWANQQTGDQGALTRFTWASAIYLLPYAVLAAPLLQLVFPRLSSAAETGPSEVRAVLTRTGPLVVVAGWLGAGLLVATAVPWPGYSSSDPAPGAPPRWPGRSSRTPRRSWASPCWGWPPAPCWPAMPPRPPA
jgi:hypothetical protein